MKVKGLENLFVGGEKSGLFVGHTEAMTTGSLAGHNAVRYCLGMPMLILPRSMALGDLIAYANHKLYSKEGRKIDIPLPVQNILREWLKKTCILQIKKR